MFDGVSFFSVRICFLSFVYMMLNILGFLTIGCKYNEKIIQI